VAHVFCVRVLRCVCFSSHSSVYLPSRARLVDLGIDTVLREYKHSRQSNSRVCLRAAVSLWTLLEFWASPH